MNLRHPFQRCGSGNRRSRKLSRSSRRVGIVRLGIEPLEGRSLLSALTLTPSRFVDNDFGYVAGQMPKTLRDCIIDANANPGSTVRLGAGTYTLSLWNTANGKPVSATNPSTGHEDASETGDLNLLVNMTIVGAGPGTIIDQTVLDRVFQVVNSGITVTLKNITITGGQAVDDGDNGALPYTTGSEGGGLLDSGGANVTLQGVTFSKNSALGSPGTSARSDGFGACGGGVYSSDGTLNISNCLFICNSAIGGPGAGETTTGGAGGDACGGALFTNDSTLAASNSTFSHNTAQGGAGGAGVGLAPGGWGGHASGGGLEIDGGPATLSSLIVSANTAKGGSGGNNASSRDIAVFPSPAGPGQVEPAWVMLVPPGMGGGTDGGGICVGIGYASGTWTSGPVTIIGGVLSANVAEGGCGGAGTAAGAVGGEGGEAIAGGLGVGGGSATLDGTIFTGNTAMGGSGGVGGSNADGGDGAMGVGGGIGAGTENLTLNGVNLTNNIAQGGRGGAGGSGAMPGSGGPGGGAWAGAVYDGYNLDTRLSMAGGWVSGNSAIGGNGGIGGSGVGATGNNGNSGGAGGTGGMGAGGGFYLLMLSSGTVSPTLCTRNTAQGGAGGNGGNGAAGGNGVNGGNGGAAGGGGPATGGGLCVTIASTDVAFLSSLTSNVARGGNAGDGGLGGTLSFPTSPSGIGHAGAGGNGGDAQGGGAYVDSRSTLTLDNALLAGNTAVGGLLGNGTPLGTNGAASGDSVYVEAGGTLEAASGGMPSKAGSAHIPGIPRHSVGP